MSAAAIVVFLIALWSAKDDLARASGLDKVVALGNLCFAAPLAVFGAEHFGEANSIMEGVPAFVPWHLFWTYLVGVALLAASLSIATKVLQQWSGLLFGIMMFLFVAMMDIPGVAADKHNRISWVLMFRQMSFGAGAWMLSASVVDGWSAKVSRSIITFGRVAIGVAAIFYGVEEFLHPALAPGVPLLKPIAAWIPAPAAIGYVTGAILLISGACILLARKTHMAATCLGAWILLLVLLVYGPMLIAALMDPNAGVKIEGLNYFFDTLLYAGTILALAGAMATVQTKPSLEPLSS